MPEFVQIDGLKRYFDVSAPWLVRQIEGRPRQIVQAVDGVDIAIAKGETFSLVGESGCGKSTVARLVVGLYPPTAGKIVFDGNDMATSRNQARHSALRRRLQMIFQDPFASLNPRWRSTTRNRRSTARRSAWTWRADAPSRAGTAITCGRLMRSTAPAACGRRSRRVSSRRV